MILTHPCSFSASFQQLCAFCKKNKVLTLKRDLLLPQTALLTPSHMLRESLKAFRVGFP